MNMTQHLIHFKGGIFINKGLTQSCYKKKTDDMLTFAENVITKCVAPDGANPLYIEIIYSSVGYMYEMKSRWITFHVESKTTLIYIWKIASLLTRINSTVMVTFDEYNICKRKKWLFLPSSIYDKVAVNLLFALYMHAYLSNYFLDEMICNAVLDVPSSRH